jgi:amidase
VSAAVTGLPEQQSISNLGSRYRTGELTASDAVGYYLDRIATCDSSGDLPINSIIEVNPDAAKIAARLDREAKKGNWCGPLHGIPILLKDNIDTGDRMQTTAGSIALLGSRAAHDAFIVARLRDAGAVILGKANLSEWANFRGHRSISGWSSRGGLTRNPHDRTRTASGSSSGSAAAVAAGFAVAAIGTETAGSITSPANACGIVGLKPTVGSLSRTGIIPIAHSQDTAGPMTRSVEDAALLFAAMRGVDPTDAATRASRRYVTTTIALSRDSLHGARIGVARQLAGAEPKVLSQFERVLTILRDQGAVLVEDVDLSACLTTHSTELTVLLHEFKHDLNRYLTQRAHPRVRSMAELIEFNNKHAGKVLLHFGQERCIEAQACGSLRTTAYREALATNQLTRAVIHDAMTQHGIDAFVTPTGGPAHVIDTLNGDGSFSTIESTSPAAVAGVPHLTVPSGLVGHMPVGLSFFGRAWSEPLLLNLAYGFEQATPAIITPVW